MHDDRDRVIKPFELAAEEAHRAEAEYAKQFEIELARRRRAREFAFRRLGLVRDLAKAACVESDETAIAAQVDCLRSELGWHDVSEAKEKVVAEFKKLATVIHSEAIVTDDKARRRRAKVARAFTEFETWYEKETGGAFLALLDHEIPEMPLVDF